MDHFFQVFRLNIIVHFIKCVLYLPINFRLPYENVARVKQFIAELLEPQLLVVGNLGQLEGSVRLQDFPLNDSKQLEWPDPQDEEEEEKGGYSEEANKLHVGEAPKVAIEDGTNTFGFGGKIYQKALVKFRYKTYQKYYLIDFLEGHMLCKLVPNKIAPKLLPAKFQIPILRLLLFK